MKNLIIQLANQFYQDYFGEDISQETQDLIGVEIFDIQDAYNLNDCDVEDQKISLGERDALEYAFLKLNKPIIKEVA